MRFNLHKVKERILIVILYMLIFGPRFKIVDMTALTSIILFGFSVVYFISEGKVQKQIARLFSMIAVLFFYSLTIAVINNFYDYKILTELMKFIVYLFAAHTIVKWYRNLYGNNFEYKINNHIFFSISFVGLTVLVFLFFQDIRYFFYDILDLYIFGWKGAEQFTHRIVDLSIGGSTMSIVFLFGFVQGILLLRRSNGWINLFYILSLSLIVFSSAVVGRTGFVMIVLTLFIYLTYKFFFENIFVLKFKKNKILFIKKNTIVISLVLIATSISVYYILNHLDENHILMTKIIPWAFEFLLQYTSDGVIATDSTDQLMREFFLPSETAQLFFGKSKFDGVSDVAYVTFIHCIGVLGLILVIMCYAYITGVGLNRFKSIFSARLLVIYSFIITIVSFKQLYFSSARGGIIIYLILFAVTASISSNTKNQFAQDS